MTRRLCEQAGFAYDIASEMPRVVHENVRWLAAYRWVEPTGLDEELADAAQQGVLFRDLITQVAASTGTPAVLIRRAAFACLWRGRLRIDLTVPLSGASVVHRGVAAEGRAAA